MEKTKFSVLMSVYKKEKPEYLKLAIDSIYSQTLIPDEVVLVEDGKLTDELETIIKEYENKYDNFVVIRYEVNRGLGPALNDGLKKCKYEYVARVDADDSCMKNRFEVQMKYLTENKDVDIVGSNMIEYDVDMKSAISTKCVPESNEKIKKYLKKRNPMNHPTVIFKKSKVIEAKGYEDVPYFEDYYLWAKMIKNGCLFYNIQENLYKFRGGSTMIKRRGGKYYLSCIKKFEKLLLKLGLINRVEYCGNVIARCFLAIMPNNFRRMFYKTILRNKN